MDGDQFVRKDESKSTLGRFITSHLRKRYVEIRKEKEATCDRLIEATNNPESNYLIHGTRNTQDSLVRFMIAARHNLLPTRHNIEKWYGKEHRKCDCGCKGAEHQTLAHLLNSCGYQRKEIIDRHDRVVSIVREIIAEKEPNAELVGENQRIEGTEGANKPDLMIVTGERVLIIDITCPYGGNQQGKRSCDEAFKEKEKKYADLRETQETRYKRKGTIIPVVVTSLGIVYKRSAQLMKQILKMTDEETKRMKKRLSIAAIKGSYEIWRRYAIGRREEEERREKEEEVEEGLVDPLDEEREDEEEEEEVYEMEPMPVTEMEEEKITEIDEDMERLFRDEEEENYDN